MRWSSGLFALGLVLAITSQGAGADRHLWRRAPAEAHAKTNPYDAHPDAVRAGRKLFARHCASCHGDQGRGGEAPHVDQDAVRDATPGDLFWFLTNGNLRHGMPSWSRLPDQRRWQLVAFLKTLAAAAPNSGRAAARDRALPTEGGPAGRDILADPVSSGIHRLE